MAQSIPSQIAAINSHSSVSLPTTTNLIRSLPKLHSRLLGVYYEDRILGVEKSDRSIQELGRRFDRDPKYISRCLKDLENWGCLESDPHGSAIKKRWITMCAFIELDTKNTNQITNQIQPIPYIDLSDQEKINTQDSKGEQNCGKLTTTPDEQLETFLNEMNSTSQERAKILNAIKCSPIGLQRKENLIARVAAVSKRKLIRNKKSYILSALQREEGQVKELQQYFMQKPVNYNLYALP